MGGADPWLRRRRLAIRGVVLPGTPAAFRAAAAAVLGAALLLALFGLLAAIGIAVDGDDLGVVNEAVDERDEAGGVGVRDAALEGLADGRLELGGAVLVEQAQKGGDDGAEIVAAQGGPLV